MPQLVNQIRIMVSSTRADLAQYREEASKIIKRVAAEREKQVQLVEVAIEKETQSGDREFAVAVSKRLVEASDWVVVIVGWSYGTISDEMGADGLSVTEWEYRYAFGLGKKLFVFVAGSRGTANEYRFSAEEREDLKDWIFKQTKEQTDKLDKFRQELCRRVVDMFVNLDMFRERLEKTLKDAIDDLPPKKTLKDAIDEEKARRKSDEETKGNRAQRRPRIMAYDVFISFKNLDEKGVPTRDAELANEIYSFLTSKGLRVFISTVTLESLGVSDYKKAIDDALDAASIVVAVGTSTENLDSRWVRYEWDGFYHDILNGRKPDGKLFTYIAGLRPAELPRTLRQTQTFIHSSESLGQLHRFIAQALR